MDRKLVACSLVVVFLACSSVAPACASRPLAAAAAGDATKVLAAGAGFATVSRDMDPGSRKPPINSRRLLGTRTTWLPPPPVPNKTRSTAMPAPPPPII